MERKVAIKKLTKLLGKSLAYRVDDKAPSEEQRREAKERQPWLVTEKHIAEKAMNDRRAAILAADDEYQRLVSEYKTAKENLQKVNGMLFRHRFTVGTVGHSIPGLGGMFSVRAEGDTWEDVIAKVEAKST